MDTITSVSGAPAVSASRTRSIKVEPLTCSIGALLENVRLADAARDGDLFAEIRANPGAALLLNYLISQACIPECQVRFRFRRNSVAIWDNRCTQHYAVQDFWPAVRNLERAGIVGDLPR